MHLFDAFALAVRDAYRSIKALSRRAKEQGRNVGAYTTDLYYQLEKMGKGSVQKAGRLVRFVVGGTNQPIEFGGKKMGQALTQQDDSLHATNQPNKPAPFFQALPPAAPPDCDRTNLPSSANDTSGATQVTDNQMIDTLRLELSPQGLVSPVTQQNLEQKGHSCSLIDVQNLQVQIEAKPPFQNIIKSDTQSNESAPTLDGKILAEVDLIASSDSRCPTASTNPLGDDEPYLLSQTELQSWLNRIASPQTVDECMDCMDDALAIAPRCERIYLRQCKKLIAAFVGNTRPGGTTTP